jgi:glutathione peroxidase
MMQHNSTRAALAAFLLVSSVGAAACHRETQGTTTQAPPAPTSAATEAAEQTPTSEVTPMSDSKDSATGAHAGTSAPHAATLSAEATKSIFETPVKTLEGKPSSLGAHRGKALLVVNVASRCGLTPQYEDLEKLHEEYAARGFSVVGFPCNQFGGQEPGTAEEIKSFCSLTYGVTFPMFEKIEVNGARRHPIYTELTKIADAKGASGDIRWNFEKFIISADGRTVTRFSPDTEPYDPAIVAAIEAGLPR